MPTTGAGDPERLRRRLPFSAFALQAAFRILPAFNQKGFDKIVFSSGVNLDWKLTALSGINQMLTIRLANLPPLDDELLAKALEFAGLKEKSVLVREA